LAKKLAFFSKANVMIKFLNNFAFLSQKRRKNRRKYPKNHNIGPRMLRNGLGNAASFRKLSRRGGKGDRIGRKFAHWVIFYSGHFLKYVIGMYNIIICM
jgi:hypothetical protein